MPAASNPKPVQDCSSPVKSVQDCSPSSQSVQDYSPPRPFSSLDYMVNQWTISSPLQSQTRTSSDQDTVSANDDSVMAKSPPGQENTLTDERKEEQVQVDRRKLEQMILSGRDSSLPVPGSGHSDGSPTSAETFFASVMNSTNTAITWPTKLKVGAKTKKDPFVKIAGTQNDVERAKKLILSVLETRHNRVTIKIDVSFTDHSHIIGKQGRNTQLAMKQTSCHIHFPDSNRNPDLEKSNMVSIAGPIQTVDQARRILRELSPLAISMDAPSCCEDPIILAEDPLIKELSSSVAGVSVIVRTNRSTGCPVFVIRGSVFQSSIIRATAFTIQQRFMNTMQAACSTAIEILQQQHSIVLGPQNINIQLISQRTGVTIQYPRGDTVTANRTTFLIQGTIDAVLSARKQLVGCLPMSFVFESQGDIVNTSGAVCELEKEYGLSISLRPKRNGDTTNVIVKGQERQASAMYEIRRRLTSTGLEELPVIPEYEFMQDPHWRHLNPSSLQLVQPISPASAPSLAVNTSMISPVTSPGAFGLPVFCQTPPFSPLPPPPVPSPSILENPVHKSHLSYRFSPVHDQPQPGLKMSSKASMEGSISSSRSSPSDSHTLSLESVSSMNSGATISIARPARINLNDPVPEEAPLASGLLEAAKKIQENSNHWKAPGAERNVNFDYDQQKVMASKAMQEKPLGLRVPNQQWAGLGFSRSMPAPMLRQARQFGVDKSIDFGESSGSSTSSGALQPLDEDEEDRIGPWPLEAPQVGLSREAFNMTTYFDSVHMPRPNNNVSLSQIDDMAIMLSQLQLTKYIDTFREQEVDMNAFLTMTDADLKELGVNTFGARRKLLVAISEIKELRRHFR